MGQPAVERDTIFVSYTRKDAKWRDEILEFLEPLRQYCDVQVWSDQDLRAGEDWYAAIRDRLARTRYALCLVSKPFLASRFCQDEELPALFQQRLTGGVEIVPLFISPCNWQLHPWLRRLNGCPSHHKTLSEMRKPQRERVLAEFFDRLAAHITTGAPLFDRPPPPDLPPPHCIDLHRLPPTADLLLGRRAEWNALDTAATDPATRLVVLRAPGGVGKSTLAALWTRDHYDQGLPGFDRAFAWSFYSQGSREQATAADPFIDAALRFFGDPDPTAGDAWDKGERLAHSVAAQRTLLILDGLEPMQAASPDPTLHGAIKDPALRTLLECLARANPGLCLVTTREPLVDLAGLDGVSDRPLDELSPVACRALLGLAGVAGTDDELESAAEDLGRHALAVMLLGTWLVEQPGRHVRAAAALPSLDEVSAADGRHPRRVMEAWADRLRARGEDAAVELLGVLGLFDRPAEPAAVAAVLAAPPIAGLTARLAADPAALAAALATLRAAGLVARARRRGRADGEAEAEIDAHPLVREHFGARLRSAAPTAWQAGHERLYRHFAGAAEFQPATLAGLEPLFRAVQHGCAAGRYQEALDEVFWRRIHRGNEAYTTKKLGAFAADLAALAGFFAAPWQEPQPALAANWRAAVLSWAAFRLRALGRLADAVAPMEAGLARYVEQADWEGAAIDAGNLAELLLTLGRLGETPAAAPGAVERAHEAVVYADRSGDGFLQMGMRTALADALHQRGHTDAARAPFAEAERLQAKRQPGLPLLYSVRGYRYGDLLLTLGEPAEARRRAEQTMVWSRQYGGSILTIALDHLLLGRAALAAAPGPDHSNFTLARRHLDAAITGLRKAGHMDYQPLGLLHRAALYRLAAELPAARRDLDEAHRIASRGGMRLHLADHLLESARLHLATGDHAAARAAYTKARAEVAAMGYHRRDPELADLAAALDGHEP
ncbi:MAG: TIR domain-containing protein [bacterium]